MAWPGRNGGSVPPGFPGDGIPSDGPGSDGRSVSRSWPGRRWRPLPADEDGGPEQPDGLVTRFQARWPGQGGSGVPPDFPGQHVGGGDPEYDYDGPLDDAADAGAGPDRPTTVVISTNPLFRRSADEEAAAEAEARRAEVAKERRAMARLRRIARATPKGFGTVVGGVYAALADPLVNASPETRARRAGQVRVAGTVAASAAVGALLVYAIFPVRSFLDQRMATDNTQEELDVLTDANERMARRAEELRQRETVEEIARRDYGMVYPGEEPYALLPAPTEGPETTTSSSSSSTTTTTP